MFQRVKVYRLNEDGKWEDQGTGHVSVDYMEVPSKVFSLRLTLWLCLNCCSLLVYLSLLSHNLCVLSVTYNLHGSFMVFPLNKAVLYKSLLSAITIFFCLTLIFVFFRKFSHAHTWFSWLPELHVLFSIRMEKLAVAGSVSRHLDFINFFTNIFLVKPLLKKKIGEYFILGQFRY